MTSPLLLHKVTIGQGIAVAAAGALTNSAAVAAVIAGLFMLINTAVNLAFENRRAATLRRRGLIFYRRPVQRRSLLPYYLNGITGVIATVALVIALTAISGRLTEIQQSRQRSATDTCYLFRVVVLKASNRDHRTQQGKRFLESVGLANCDAYGARVTRVK